MSFVREYNRLISYKLIIHVFSYTNKSLKSFPPPLPHLAIPMGYLIQVYFDFVLKHHLSKPLNIKPEVATRVEIHMNYQISFTIILIRLGKSNAC